MDDIIPFIVFVIIAIVNFFTERGKKKRYGKDKLRKPNEKSNDEFNMDNLLRQFTESPEEKLEPILKFEEEEKVFEIKEEYPPATIFNEEEDKVFDEEIKKIEHTKKIHQETIHSAFKAMPSKFITINTLNIPNISLRNSNTHKSLNFPIKKRKVLKNAIIANIVFNRPRAYDINFDYSHT